MPTFMVRHSEGDPVIVVADSFGLAVMIFTDRMIAEDEEDIKNCGRDKDSVLTKDDVWRQIDGVDKLSDDDPIWPARVEG